MNSLVPQCPGKDKFVITIEAGQWASSDMFCLLLSVAMDCVHCSTRWKVVYSDRLNILKAAHEYISATANVSPRHQHFQLRANRRETVQCVHIQISLFVVYFFFAELRSTRPAFTFPLRVFACPCACVCFSVHVSVHLMRLMAIFKAVTDAKNRTERKEREREKNSRYLMLDNDTCVAK